MKNGKDMYDSKFVARSKGYYAVMLFMEKPTLLKMKFPNNCFNSRITKNNDCIDDYKLLACDVAYKCISLDYNDGYWDNGSALGKLVLRTKNICRNKRNFHPTTIEWCDQFIDIPRWDY